MTRAFGYVLAAVFVLCAFAFKANERADTLQAAIYLSLAVSLLGTYAIVTALIPEAEKRDALVRDRRTLLDEADVVLLAAFPEPAGPAIEAARAALAKRVGR